MSLSEKQIQCIALLTTGMAQKDVAEALDTTPRTIQRWQREQDFMQALQASEAGQVASQQNVKVVTEIVSNVWQGRDQLRQRELTLLNNLELALMNSLEQDNSNYRAIDRLIRISERRSKLLGLDIRNLPVLGALEILLTEQVATCQQADIVGKNISSMEQELREIGGLIN